MNNNANINNIPPSLRAAVPFCCYRIESINGRIAKIPYNPITGGRAQTNNPQTFTDFQTALSAVHNYNGLGFLITNNIFVIDCDNCRNTDDSLTATAAEIITIFAGCYMEWSPSGNGLHIIGRASGFNFDKSVYWMNNRRLNVEVYLAGATNRFMTVTGNVFREGDVLDKPAELQRFLEKYMRRDSPAPEPPPITESTLSDSDIIEKAANAKNGITFRRLWAGDCSGYLSQSEAELALSCILAFWCGKNIAQMDRLIRQSGLFREKWDRPQSGTTYGQITLEKAVRDTPNVFTPKKTRNPRITATSPVENAESSTHKPEPPCQDSAPMSPTLQVLHPEENPRYCWTDIGNGRLFADFYYGIARYVKERKMWFVFNGKHWTPDLGGLYVMELAKKLADMLVNYATKITDEHKRSAYLKYVMKWQQRKTREVVVKEARSVYHLSMLEFDRDSLAFNCQNGTLHLDTMQFKPHDSTELITKISPVKYDPAARCERWEQFITEIMPNNPDTASFIQRVLGYGLSGETYLECLFIFYGVTTRNGKGTLCESVLKVMGDYGLSVKPETIAIKHKSNSNSPSEDVARLNGVRFANISEPDKGLVLNAAQVKNMTGRDGLTARFLYENSFDFYPHFKIYINTNHRPNIQDVTLFTSDRIYIVPFERHFDAAAQDHTLKDLFMKPENQSGILNWLIEGYRQLKAIGLSPSATVTNAINEYHHDSDKVSRFIEDELIPNPNGELRTSVVYKKYQSWCKANGCYSMNSTNFKQALQTVENATVGRKRPRDGGSETTLLWGFDLPPRSDKDCDKNDNA